MSRDEVDAEALRAIRGFRRGDGTGVALLATRLGRSSLLAAVEAGVGGVLNAARPASATSSPRFRPVAAGEGTLPPDMLARLIDLGRAAAAPGAVAAGSDLLRADRARAERVAPARRGARHGRGERPLYYSDRTVKNIIHDITSRLELRNRTHAVAYAIKQGLI